MSSPGSHIAGYRGYGTRERALVLGRVLRDARVAKGHATQSAWRNLVDTIRRIETDPIPFARVRARLLGAEHEIVADDEGFLRTWVPVDRAPTVSGWHEVELELVDESRADHSRDCALVHWPSPDARFGVISDLDDTVLQSKVSSFLRAARLILLENARTRLPFPGVAAFYRALERGSSSPSPASPTVAPNPIFYVSSSPWNLYDVIVEFLTAQRIPLGPVLLRDWDFGRSLLRNRGHKVELIREILGAYPSLPFILIGDSTQEDPEIYSEIVCEHPGRILAVYIRNVESHPERSSAITALAEVVRAAGSTLVLADDTLAAARHAAEHGWIDAGTLAEIEREKAGDEGRTGEKIEAPGVDTPSAPTVVIDSPDSLPNP